MTRGSKTAVPGERKTRSRQRRYILYMLLAACVGAALGWLLNTGDSLASDVFADAQARSLSQPLAFAAIALLIGGFFVLPLWGFKHIDELQKEQNFIAFTGGAMAVLAGYPIWAVLTAASLIPAPTAFSVFMLAMIGMLATLVVVNVRERF